MTDPTRYDVVRDLIHALQVINGMPPFKPLIEAQMVSDAALRAALSTPTEERQ